MQEVIDGFQDDEDECEERGSRDMYWNLNYNIQTN